MAKLRIRRKAYTTKSGTRVKATTYLAKDRGKPGRTPKSQQWYNPKTETGWRKTQPAYIRRRSVLGAHKGDLLASARSMQALANVTTDKMTRQQAKADAKYFYDRYNKGKK